MSYILDALKKSEKERAIGNVPTLDVVSDRPTESRGSSGKSWWIIGIFLFLSVASAFGFFYRKEMFAEVAEFTNDSTDTAEVPIESSTAGKVKASPVSAMSSAGYNTTTEQSANAVKKSQVIDKKLNTSIPDKAQVNENTRSAEKPNAPVSIAKVNSRKPGVNQSATLDQPENLSGKSNVLAKNSPAASKVDVRIDTTLIASEDFTVWIALPA